MTFLWPGLLLLLLAVPLLIAVYVWALRRRRVSGVRFSSLSLVHVARPGSARWRRHVPFALFAAAIGALVLAVGRPVAIAAVPTNQTTIVLVMDVSGSMCSTDIEPTRLVAAQDAAATFIEHQSTTTQIGIVAFSGFAQIVQAPTNDKAALIASLRSLTTGRRTAVGAGILAAIDAIAEVDPSIQRSTGPDRPGTEPPPVTPGAYAPAIIVALTDGATNFGPEPEDAAAQAATRGLRVYTIGFGTPEGGQLDPVCASQFRGREPGGGFGGGGGGGGGFRRGIDDAALRQVAELTDATYYPAESADQLEGVFAGLPMNLVLKHDVVELGVGFVAAGLLFAGGGLLLGRAWRPLP
ncbi:MAG TPA: VWA domain-containing protein [Candidatus Limnocylindrales bacterium]